MRLSLRLKRPGDEEGGLTVRGQGQPGTGPFQDHSQKARQEGAPTLSHSIQDYLSLSAPASQTCTSLQTQQTTVCLLQRCLPSQKPSSGILTLRLYRHRGPPAILAPIPDLLGSLAHTTCGLALNLTPIPDPFTSAFPSSRDRHCQHLAQASLSLARISNKERGSHWNLACFCMGWTEPSPVTNTLGP